MTRRPHGSAAPRPRATLRSRSTAFPTGPRSGCGSSTDFRLWHPAPEPGGQNSVGFGRKADEATQRASEPFVTQMRLL